MDGPIARTKADRRALVEQIDNQLHTVYADNVRAIGLLGSTARGDDGPYSNVEMICVVLGSMVDRRYEWSPGPWKAEVNVRSQDVLEQKAKSVDVDWPMTHGKYVDMQPRYDPEHLFDHARELATSQPEDAFRRAIQDSVVGEQYELMGKLRNAHQEGNPAYFPAAAIELAKHAACMVALAHRTMFSSASTTFQECLTLSNRPNELDPLVNSVMSGDLSRPDRVVATCNRYWSHVGEWLEGIGVEVRDISTIAF